MSLTDDLFGESAAQRAARLGFTHLRGFAAPLEQALLTEIGKIATAAPFRHMLTPGGQRMSAAMTNCGAVGWVTDRKGYRYDPIDPETGRAWPALPLSFLELAERAAALAGFAHFRPDVCLINRYEPGARMSLHQDRDERDFSAPIVSVSLGLDATFLFGGLKRSDKPYRLPVQHGDVVVWGGATRLAYHGVAPVADGCHSVMGRMRLNLTMRRAL
ncbi:MAG TPA: DNA oxidative demethylase AlkB [Steroidobacteraceae bacterium]|nr:DNA oxidative demethylase AlkB [Steroidobacteraceae bacterium]